MQVESGAMNGNHNQLREDKKADEVFRNKQVVVYKIKSCETSTCPICGGCFCVIGIRRRQMINTAGDLEILIIRRLRCEDKRCRKIHHELPDCLYPYKRHCAETIENVIDGKEDNTPCGIDEAERLKKWWNTIHPYFVKVLLSLNAKHGTCFDHTASPREVVRAVVNSHSWVHTRLLVTRRSRVVTIIPKPTECERDTSVGKSPEKETV